MKNLVSYARRVFYVVAITAALMFAFIPAFNAKAQPLDIFNEACNSVASGVTRPSTCDGSPATNPAAENIGKVSKLIAYVAGGAAIIVIVISGIRMSLASGDPKAITEARNTIIFSVVGVIAIILARTLVMFIVGRVTS